MGALLTAVLAALVFPTAALADAWTPSTWTGPAAGPPVPGTGLPPAATPNITRGMPPAYDNAPLYEAQAQCDPPAKIGTQALADLIKATYGANQTVWIPRACDIGDTSEHKEGRALDWMTSVRDPQQRANAEAFLSWLLGPDAQGNAYGNAMRLGVMYIGWNDRIWRGYDINRGWTELKGCFATPSTGSDTTCHRNHIHISLTWDGASGRTSFWSGNPMNVPYCPAQKASGSVASPGRANDATAVGPVRVVDTRSGAGVPTRCRLAQDRESGDSNRIVAKVTGQGGIPGSGVAAVQVTASALASTAPAKLRIWSPGEGKSDVVATPGMNQDANGTAIVPVSTDGTIELAISAGSADVVVDVTGWYGPGDTPNTTKATPAAAQAMQGAPTIPAPAPGKAPAPAAPAPAAPAPAAPAPAAPAPAAPSGGLTPPNDEFVAMGSDVGFESNKPLPPGQQKVITLNGIPEQATSALVVLTAKQAPKPGELRIAPPGVPTPVTAMAYGKGVRSTVMVVPVTGGKVALQAAKAPVQVRVEVLGYAVNNGLIKIRGLAPKQVTKSKIDSGATVEVPVTGVGGLPKKAKWISAVVLKVRTKGKDKKPGNVTAYPANGQAPATRSAPVTPGKPYTSLVVAKVSPDGKIVISSSSAAKVTATIVGWVHV